MLLKRIIIFVISMTVIGCSSSSIVINDAKDKLQWAPAPNSDTNWYQAKEYVENLKLGGFSDWRLPTRIELQSLYSNGVDPKLNVANKWAWTSETIEPSFAWYVNMYNGVALDYPRENSYLNRVLAVRSMTTLK